MTIKAGEQLRLGGLTNSFGAFDAVKSVDPSVARGAFCALLGPSGCGEPTLLRLIAGLEDPKAGRIHIAGRDAALADKIVVMNGGAVQQIGAPMVLNENPPTALWRAKSAIGR